MNVVLVWKKGGDFSFRDVELLSTRIKDHNPRVSVFCLSETEKEMKLNCVTLLPFTCLWNGWWSKLNLFSPDLEELRPFLFMDLDTACIGSLEFCQSLPQKGFGMLQDFHRPNRAASGVMWIPKGNNKIGKIWTTWVDNPSYYMSKFRGDQDFIGWAVKPDFLFQRVVPGKIVSFKPTRRQWLTSIPTQTSLVCFHGFPRIWQAAEKVSWVEKYIQEGLPRRNVKRIKEEKINWERRDALPYIRPWFSLLCPTRGRPKWAERYAQSVFRTAHNPDSIEILFYVDADDPTLPEYVKIFSQTKGCKLVVGPPQGVGRAWNALARMSDGEYLMMANDDLVHETMEWDKELLQRFAKFPDGIFLAWCNDGINGDKHCAFPIVSRTWLKELSEFVPECYHFFRHDTDIFETAKQVGIKERLLYCPDIFIKHYHHSLDITYRDETTVRNRNNNQDQKDKKIYESQAQYTARKKKAHRLRQAIEEMDHFNGNAFRELVQGKRVALVGPSPHLQGKEMGDYIDRYDVVCRVNELFPFGLEQDYGSRTDILFYGCNVHNYTNFEKAVLHAKKKNEAILENLKMFVTIQRRKDTNNICSQYKFYSLVEKQMPQAKLGIISLYHWEFYHRWIKTHPNSGILALCMLAQAKPKELYLTGFSFYALGNKPEKRHHKAYIHWGGDKGLNEIEIEKLHDQETQKRWFVNQFYPAYQDILILDDFLREKIIRV